MAHLIIILGYSVTLGIPEIIIFSLSAVLLGFSIHFYWFGKRSVPGIQHVFKGETLTISEEDQWRLEFYEQLEQQHNIQQRLERELNGAKEAEKLLLRELEESRDELSRIALLQEKVAVAEKNTSQGYPASRNMSDLVIAQQNLNDFLSKEMTERLQKAYHEFSFLQDKIQKIESNIIEPHSRQHEYEGLQESYYRITKECDEVKLRNLSLMEENQRLTRTLSDTEEKLRDANFQKIQLAKKVVFLEELANDLQQVAGHHKKLEAQLKRISEIEDLLSKSTQEK
jgi:hypothetical protein